MRITEGMINDQSLADIQSILKRYADLNRQLTSGKTVQYPSDNAAVVSRVSNLQSRGREIDRYLTNISSAENYNNMYDTISQEMSTIYTRVKELMVKANTELAPEDRKAISEELVSIRDHFASLANTKIAGKSIYGGLETDKDVVVKKDGVWEINISQQANVQPKVSAGGYDISYGLTVYQVFQTGNGNSVFSIFDRAINAVESSDREAIDKELGSIEYIEKQNLNSLSKIGGTEKLLEMAKNRFENFKSFSKEYLSLEYDADSAEVITQLGMQKMILESALKTTANVIPKTLVDFIS
ncbi:MAG TPA: hypothetical protein PLS66_01240 [Tepiditoga sp.]|nr:flagellar hook-associated protein 3 [Thermotogota bacterium]HOO73891.1 hypothetical protein [Tepiditoga sp.]